MSHRQRGWSPVSHWGPLAVAATVALTVGIGATTAYWAGRAGQDEARINALSTQSRLDHQALAALAGGPGRDLALHGTSSSPAAHGAVRLDPASSQSGGGLVVDRGHQSATRAYHGGVVSSLPSKTWHHQWHHRDLGHAHRRRNSY